MLKLIAKMKMEHVGSILIIAQMARVRIFGIEADAQDLFAMRGQFHEKKVQSNFPPCGNFAQL